MLLHSSDRRILPYRRRGPPGGETADFPRKYRAAARLSAGYLSY